MAIQKIHQVSYETIRQLFHQVDKFSYTEKQLGYLYANQSVRQIGRLHTHYPGQRTELDYTKYGVWLFPNENWSEPLFYYTGIGIDHFSTVVKGFTVTVDPSARDAVRLYRICVLPKPLYLPPHLRHLAQHWDVFGLEIIVAIDNAVDVTANAVVLMFLINGAILLRMPPRRGDFKGGVERTQSAFEDMFIRSLPGYVSRKYSGLDSRYTKIRERAKAKANLTVAEYETRYVESIHTYNHEKHPRLKKPRIQVWRDGQELAPIVLPTSRLQIRITFALTYEASLNREGVVAEGLKFNSPELHQVYLSYSGKVHVKLDPDDIRSVLVMVPQLDEPVEAFLTTFDIDFPMTLELLKVVLKRLENRFGEDKLCQEDIGYVVLEELHRLQSRPHTPTSGKTVRSDAQAAKHAAAMPPVQAPAQNSAPTPDLTELLKGSKLA